MTLYEALNEINKLQENVAGVEDVNGLLNEEIKKLRSELALKEKEISKLKIDLSNYAYEIDRANKGFVIRKDMARVKKHPDFNEWLLTDKGQKCSNFLTLYHQTYLKNRLFWAFDAGRNCVWDQLVYHKELNEVADKLIEAAKKEPEYNENYKSEWLEWKKNYWDPLMVVYNELKSKKGDS